MHRIDSVDNVASQFAGENALTGQNGTVVTPEWLTAVQEEIAHVIEGAGLALVKANNSQLVQCVPSLTGWFYGTLPASGTWAHPVWTGTNWVTVMANSNIAATSPNGLVWTQRTLPASVNWSCVTYHSGLALLVAVASGSSIAATSADNGVTWTQRAMLSSQAWALVAPGTIDGAGGFMAASGSSNVGAISGDGATWTAITLPGTGPWVALACNWGGPPATWALAASNAATVQTTVNNGFAWSSRTPGMGANARGLVGLGSTVGTLLAAISASGAVLTSVDGGVTWKSVFGGGLGNEIGACTSFASGTLAGDLIVAATYGLLAFVPMSDTSAVTFRLGDGQRIAPPWAGWTAGRLGAGATGLLAIGPGLPTALSAFRPF